MNVIEPKPSVGQDDDKAPRGGGWFRGWSLSKKIVAAIVAVAGALGSLQAGIGAISKTWNFIQNESTPKEQQRLETEFDRTPGAGLEFWQGNELAPMRFRDDQQRVVRVELRPKPFVLRAPKVPRNVAIQICAWNDDSIFVASVNPAEGVPQDDVECLQQGRGIADSEYASGRLFVNRDGHNYLIDTRLRQHSPEQDRAFFSTTSEPDKPDRPLSARTAPLYLVVCIDRNRNRVIELGEYEALELVFA